MQTSPASSGVVAKLTDQMAEIELAWPVARLHASFVGGIERVPIRYRLEAPAA